MRISVVIPTLNRAKDLKVALESILKQTAAPREVIVVDQSENPETRLLVEMMQRPFGSRIIDLIYIHQREKSLVKARNTGLAAAAWDIVSFLDDDISLMEDYFENVRETFESDPNIGGVSGNTLVEAPEVGFKWTLRQKLMRFFLLSGFDGRMTVSGFGFPIFEREISKVVDVEMLPGCNMNFRRDAIAGHRFDDWFSGYGYREDVDFSYRVSRSARLVMTPDARLYHYQSPVNRLDVASLKKMEIKNYLYLFKKHKDRGAFSKWLFAYSLFGLTLIDGIEFLSKRSRDKYNKFRATLSASISVWFDELSQPRLHEANL